MLQSYASFVYLCAKCVYQDSADVYCRSERNKRQFNYYTFIYSLKLMKLKKLLTKTLLVAAGLCVGAVSAWADNLPTPVYYEDFELASILGSTFTGSHSETGTLVGTGSIESGDATFGRYYQNSPSSIENRANYLKINTEAFQTASIASNKAVTLSFWVKTDGQNYGWNSIFNAYTDEGYTATAGSNAYIDGYGAFIIRANTSSHAKFSDYEYHSTWDSDPTYTDNYTWGTTGWHHIAYVLYDNSGKTHLNLYIDGSLNTNVDLAQSGAGTLWSNLSSITNYVIGGCSGLWYDGDVDFGYDKIAIYDEALSASQVQQIAQYLDGYDEVQVGTTLDFETESGFSTGWSFDNGTIYRTSYADGSEYYLDLEANNARSGSYTFSNANLNGVTRWRLNFDWGGNSSYNGNGELLFSIKNSLNKDIVSLSTAAASTSVTVKDANASAVTQSTAMTVPMRDRNHYNQVVQGSAVPTYNVDLMSDGTNIVLTIKSLDLSTTYVNAKVVATASSLGSFSYSFPRNGAGMAFDNVKTYIYSDIDVITEPTITYTIDGSSPTVVSGTSSNGSATLTTYYCASESDDPASDGTEWVQGTTTLPSAGTYYFYTVSNKGGISAATTYKYYVSGIYENYEFGSWASDAGAFDFSSPTSFGGHNLYDRFSFDTSWTVNSGIKTTAQGATITISGLTTSDYLVLTFTGSGNIRTITNNLLMLNGNNVASGTALTSGTLYQCNASTISIWDRNSSGGGVISRIQIITPSYTLTTPTIEYGEPGVTTDVTITPGVVRNTDASTAATTTYITTNGDDPTSEENERVTSLTSVSESVTVKAASYYGGSYSSVASVYVPVGSIQLNAPAATFTGVGESSGHYYKMYTISSNQSEYGSPAVTYTYQYSTDDFESVAASGTVDGTTFIAPGIGKLRFYATNDGYDDSDASEDIVSDVEFVATSVYDFANYSFAENATLSTANTSEYLYHAIPGLYLYNSKKTIKGLYSAAAGIYYTSDDNSGYYGVFGALDGQVLKNGNSYYMYSAGKIEFNQWRGDTGSNRLAGLTIYTPTTLLATASDVTVDDGVVDLSGKVIYSGNLSVIAAAIAAKSGVKKVKIGQIGCDLTATQIQSLLPADDVNNVFVQLPANSYYEIIAGANLKTSTGSVTSYVLNDAKDYAIEEEFTPSVGATYDRTFTQDVVSTICLPFAIDAETAATLGKFYQLKSTTTTENVVFESVEATEALKPYLFIPAATGTITIPANTEFVAADGVTTQTFGNVTLNGSIASSAFSSTIYGFASSGKLVTANSGTMNPFRAYLTTTAGARLSFYTFDDETTGIASVKVESENVRFFNLQGQAVAIPNKGLYIVNGKKVIIK